MISSVERRWTASAINRLCKLSAQRARTSRNGGIPGPSLSEPRCATLTSDYYREPASALSSNISVLSWSVCRLLTINWLGPADSPLKRQR